MSEHIFNWQGAQVRLVELGDGPPLLYLHGLVDLNGCSREALPFHELLAAERWVLAPALPGCAGSEGIERIHGIDDLEFYILDCIDALELRRPALVGNCLGGWLAAELAVRHSHRFSSLTLINPFGLRVASAPTADFFMAWQRVDGIKHHDFRSLFFAQPESPLAHAWFPDAKPGPEAEILRYRALTLAARIGWVPPYCYNPKLRDRLRRIELPTLVVWGAENQLLSTAHGEAYAEAIPGAWLETIPSAGHAVIAEQPAAVADLLQGFVAAPLRRPIS